jgi:hypothetical protein
LSKWGPAALTADQQAKLKAAVQGSPQEVGLDLANWNWKVVLEFIQQRFGWRLSRSGCLNYLHRLGFVLKWPKKRLVKAKAADPEAFVACYATLRLEAQAPGGRRSSMKMRPISVPTPTPTGRGECSKVSQHWWLYQSQIG